VQGSPPTATGRTLPLAETVTAARRTTAHGHRQLADTLGWTVVQGDTLATAAGLSPSRVHQLVAAAGLDALDAALGELRAAGWPAPEHPDSGEDTELGGRDTIAGRLSDEVSWLRQCAGWLAQLGADSCPSAVSLRPAAGWPDRAVVAAGLGGRRRS
jgi:hypothetical protein